MGRPQGPHSTSETLHREDTGTGHEVLLHRDLFPDDYAQANAASHVHAPLHVWTGTDANQIYVIGLYLSLWIKVYLIHFNFSLVIIFLTYVCFIIIFL